MIRKTVLLELILLMAFWIGSSAQRNIAIRAGLDAIPTSSNNQTHDGNLPKGFHAGLMGNFAISSRMVIQPEVQYVWMKYYSRTNVPEDQFVQGIAQKYQLPTDQARQLISSYDQKTDKTTSYLFVPLLLKYRFSQEMKFIVGPQIGFILGNKNDNDLSATVGGQPIENNTTISSVDGMRNTQFALSGGLEFKLSKIADFEFRYTRSLNTLEASGSKTSSYYNFIQFSVILFLL